ncbi:type II toxin-antitoxin system Phd/YefM family antitoxin [Acinetobacter sp. WCHAc060025]|uniref:Antitoxin n=2 Tax=Moraxellaceae TaxID=468 RepID=A0A3G2T329_9GAMM|nr:type II toxin-antitoxin system Phd/YefM family antitoxin [Acinetobacter wuhouensis]RZG48652.1 type II toxin-antitoxin system Phd/YefM family antitoxin [Acinetobacter wuhouensis]RZG73037.1 type II toxin-antitoxin system Phd/YefM family antitoxin [Acinetobacter wuhouensis]RZG74998.1 type II toxin-antitoxin system Phd/YefM family antitoxin [Acinetobacter sp. WCHAc060025]
MKKWRLQMQISSREFNHDIGKAKKSSLENPVIITERGKPSHVLLSYRDYEKLIMKQSSMADLLSSDDNIEIEFKKLNVQAKAVELD